MASSIKNEETVMDVPINNEKTPSNDDAEIKPKPTITDAGTDEDSPPETFSRMSSSIDQDTDFEDNEPIETDFNTETEFNTDLEENTGPKSHTVYPVHLLDNAMDYRQEMMSYLLRFNDILDGQKLADSLSELLEIGDWRKLGGRLRLKPDGYLEIYAPNSFNSNHPAITYSDDCFDGGVEIHPVGQQLPETAVCPAVLRLGSNLRFFAGFPRVPTTVSEIIDQDVPMMSLHVTTFNNATVVVISWPRLLMDSAGLQAMLRSWSMVINGQLKMVPMIKGAHEDILANESSLQKELWIDGFRPGLFGRIMIFFYFIWRLFQSPKFEEKTIIIPPRFVEGLYNQAMADILPTEGSIEDAISEKSLVNREDVITVWAARFVANISTKSRPVTIINSLDLRQQLYCLRNDSTTSAYIQNMVQYTYASLSSKYVGGTLGDAVLSYRQQQEEQSAESQVKGYIQMQRGNVLAKKKLQLQLQHSRATPFMVDHLGADDFFKAINFIGAVTRYNDGYGIRMNPPGSILYYHPVALNSSTLVEKNHLRLLGKDHGGSYWLTGAFQALEWERIMFELSKLY